MLERVGAARQHVVIDAISLAHDARHPEIAKAHQSAEDRRLVATLALELLSEFAQRKRLICRRERLQYGHSRGRLAQAVLLEELQG